MHPLFLATAAPSASSGLMQMLPMMVLIGAFFYFFMIRPQQKARKEHQNMINNVKKGDEIVTSGGLLGKVTKVSKDENIGDIEVEFGENVRMRVVKATITAVNPKTKEDKEKTADKK